VNAQPQVIHLAQEKHTWAGLALILNAAASEEIRGVVRYIQDHWQRQYGYVQVG
jgi:hypothetical protein